VLKSALRTVAIGASVLTACGVMATAATAAPSAGSGKALHVRETKSALTGIPKTLASGQYSVSFSGPQSRQGTFFQFIRLSKGYSEQQMLGDLQADFTGKSTRAQRTRLYNRAFFAGGSGVSTDKYSAYLAPGSYVVGDFINGKFQSLTVTKGSGPATPPAGNTIKAVTMNGGMLAFDVAGTLSHDKALKFVNTTDQPHFVTFAKLKGGTSAKDCLMNGKGCTPGYTSGAISKGESEVIPANVVGFTPGRYVVACFIPDEKTGQPHALMGMYKEFTVK
jgi:hypothetical protein